METIESIIINSNHEVYMFIEECVKKVTLHDNEKALKAISALDSNMYMLQSNWQEGKTKDDLIRKYKDMFRNQPYIYEYISILK